jgi:DNA-binding XRE family transcriptional regulator
MNLGRDSSGGFMSAISHLKTTENEYAAAAFNIRRQIGDLSKQKRQLEGLTLREAGERAGISFTTLLRIENVDRQTTIENLETVCRWLGMRLTLVPISESL